MGRYCFELRQGEQKLAKDAKTTVPRCVFHGFKIVVNPELPFAHSCVYCAVTLKRSCTKECICNAEVCAQQLEDTESHSMQGFPTPATTPNIIPIVVGVLYWLAFTTNHYPGSENFVALPATSDCSMIKEFFQFTYIKNHGTLLRKSCPVHCSVQTHTRQPMLVGSAMLVDVRRLSLGLHPPRQVRGVRMLHQRRSGCFTGRGEGAERSSWGSSLFGFQTKT